VRAIAIAKEIGVSEFTVRQARKDQSRENIDIEQPPQGRTRHAKGVGRFDRVVRTRRENAS
jgi:hypothetical protein